MTLTTNSASSSIRRFGKASRTLRSRNNEPLTDDAIRACAPSIFAAEAHLSRSARYAYIPTSQVLAGLRREGFQPFMVTQGSTRDDERKGFTKHMLRLRHRSAEALKVGGTFNEIVLVNSHDGSSTYQLMAGMFRLVCSNGMVVGAGSGFSEVRVKHTGDAPAQVIEGAVEILARLPEVNEQVREWDSMALNDGERLAFARAALALRYEAADKAPMEAPRLLTLRRQEDKAPTAWNTLNVVQENIVEGGLKYDFHSPTGQVLQHRKTRPIQGIDGNVSLNRALWTLAAEMAKLKKA